MNLVSSQNGKAASVPLLEHRARSLLGRDGKEGTGGEGRGGEGQVTTGKSDSRLQGNPLHSHCSMVRGLICVHENSDWFCLVLFNVFRCSHLLVPRPQYMAPLTLSALSPVTLALCPPNLVQWNQAELRNDGGLSTS